MNVFARSVVTVVAGLSVAGLAGVAAGASAAPDAPTPGQQSAQEVPTTAQVVTILNNLVDPSVSDQSKKSLVQGGVNADERRAFRHDRLTKAASHGDLPLSFTVGNVWSVGPNTAAAQVVVAGPKLSPSISEVLTFVNQNGANQNGWMLSDDSAATLIEDVTKS